MEMPIVGPSVIPVGMASDPDPSTLPPNLLRLAQNLRFSRNAPIVRQGCTLLNPSPVFKAGVLGAPDADFASAGGGPTLLGWLSNPTYGLYAVWRGGTAVTTRIYRLLGTYEWAEVTNVASRMSTNSRVGLEIVQAPGYTGINPAPALIVSPAGEDPRVVMLDFMTDPVAYIHSPITAPASPYQIPTPYSWVRLNAGIVGSVDSTAANFASAIGADKSIQLQRKTAGALADNIEVTWTLGETITSASSFTLLGQLLLICSDTTPNYVWDYIGKVEIWNGSYTTIWSDDSVDASPPFYIDLGPVNEGAALTGDPARNAYIIGFDCSRLGAIANITKIKFTCRINITPSAVATTKIVGILSSGMIDSESIYAASYLNQDSRSESISKVCEQKQGPSLKSLGAGDAWASIRWTPTTYLLSSFYIYVNASLTDNVTLYRSEREQSERAVTYGEYWQCGSVSVATSASSHRQYIHSNTEVNRVRKARDANHLCIPRGRVLCSANARLYVADDTDSNSQLYASMVNDPFSFATRPSVSGGRIVPTSATYRTFSGQIIGGIKRVSGEMLGADSILVFTSKGYYKLGNYDAETLMQAAHLGDKGALGQWSIDTFDGEVWWMDPEGNVRVSSGGLSAPSPSETMIEDRLASTDTSRATGISLRNRYALLYKRSNPARIMNWFKIPGGWTEDQYPFSIEGICSYTFGTTVGIMALSTGGFVRRLEDPSATNDGGTAISFDLWGRELHDSGWNGVGFSEIGVVTDPGAYTLATERWMFGALTVDSLAQGVIDLTDVTSSTAWRKDVVSGKSYVPIAEGYGCSPRLKGTVASGFRIREMVINVQPMGDRADAKR
jgi:hypothetical protein